ncbi:PEP-CTERM sorting domain-containing protein [Lentisalinibacter salinarum]|uniref:PEP-CTERM sorting domain-containing protein n=1 Tax=Lentisalinibacter salinarum TaxID=2992239 RepID=UPI00386B7235
MHLRSLVCLLLLLSASVFAEPITVRFEGEIDFTRFFGADPFAGAITEGSRFSGTYRYDGDAPNQATSPVATGGIYLSEGRPYGFSLTIEGMSGNSFGSSSSLLYRTENRFEDGIDIQTSDMIFAGISAYLTQLNLLDSTGTALQSRDLPQGAPTLSDWDTDRRTFFLGLGEQNDPIAVYQGTITRFLPVPEPSTLALLSAGLIGMGFTRRRKKAE